MHELNLSIVSLDGTLNFDRAVTITAVCGSAALHITRPSGGSFRCAAGALAINGIELATFNQWTLAITKEIDDLPVIKLRLGLFLLVHRPD
jgi:hypothetical protein